MEFIISKHCKEQLQLRNIPEDLISQILHAPMQITKEDECTMVYQSIISAENEKKYLYRIFVNICKQPNLVITVYRTSKIDKYHENKI